MSHEPPDPFKEPLNLTKIELSPCRWQCRACGLLLLLKNQAIADGCPCNSVRGINHGLVPKDVCTCVLCDPAQTGSSRMSPVAETHEPDTILQFFSYKHLHPNFQLVSKRFHDLVMEMTQILPNNSQRELVFLRLLEAKDAAVRAAIMK
jgi:hypothetical protein